ncbi:35011_t:CDS:2, partial [Gigaspora margarita]
EQSLQDKDTPYHKTVTNAQSALSTKDVSQAPVSLQVPISPEINSDNTHELIVDISDSASNSDLPCDLENREDSSRSKSCDLITHPLVHDQNTE